MKPSNKCIQLIEKFEGLRLEAYVCPAGVVTIGIGSTRHIDGSRVKMGEVITREHAYQMLMHDLDGFSKAVDDLTTDKVNQNQFDALVSFVYNCGRSAYQNSTLRRVVNANPNDNRVRTELMKWVNAGGRRLKGLERRRSAEADLYFS